MNRVSGYRDPSPLSSQCYRLRWRCFSPPKVMLEARHPTACVLCPPYTSRRPKGYQDSLPCQECRKNAHPLHVIAGQPISLPGLLGRAGGTVLCGTDAFRGMSSVHRGTTAIRTVPIPGGAWPARAVVGALPSARRTPATAAHRVAPLGAPTVFPQYDVARPARLCRRSNSSICGLRIRP